MTNHDDDAYRRGFDYGCQQMRERCAKLVEAPRMSCHDDLADWETSRVLATAIRALEIKE